MPKRGKREVSVEPTPSQEITEGIGELVVEDPITPRPITRSMTPQVAIVPTTGIIASAPSPRAAGGSPSPIPETTATEVPAPLDMFNLEIHGVIVREESGEYYAPQQLLFACDGSAEQVADIKHKTTKILSKGIIKNPRLETYKFKTSINYPLKISKVSGIDRGFTGNKILKPYSRVVRARRN